MKGRKFNRIQAVLLIISLLLISIMFIELCSIEKYKTSLKIEKLEMQNMNLQFAAYSKEILKDSKDKLCKTYIKDIGLIPKNQTSIENSISKLNTTLTVNTVEQYRC